MKKKEEAVNDNLYIEFTIETAVDLLRRDGFPDVFIHGYSAEAVGTGIIWGVPHMRTTTEDHYYINIDLDDAFKPSRLQRNRLYIIAAAKLLLNIKGSGSVEERTLIREWAILECRSLPPDCNYYEAGRKASDGGKKGSGIQRDHIKDDLKSRDVTIALKAFELLSKGIPVHNLAGSIAKWAQTKEGYPRTSRQIRNILKSNYATKKLYQKKKEIPS